MDDDEDDDTLLGKWTLGASPRESPSVHSGEDTPTPAPWRDDDDGALPMRQIPLGPRVPDLAAIDRTAWRRVLTQIPEALRTKAALHPYLDADRRAEAFELALALPPSPTDGLARRCTRAPASRCRGSGGRAGGR